jgi:quercetin dioxygenase-like cupin family protein
MPRFVRVKAYSRECMKILILVLTLSVAGFATQQHAPISADEVTLRHRIYEDGRVTVFLLDIPPGQATVLHRHDRDMLSVFVNGGRTRASFNGAPPVEDSFTPGEVRFRSAGFTHSTENLGTDRFLSVIFEFTDSQGPRASVTRPATHVCNPDSQTACVTETPLFCTSKFCVDDLTMEPRAIRPAGGVREDQILVAVSDYSFSEEAPGTAAAVHARKSGETEPMAAGPARRWTNAGNPAHLIVVTVR